MKSKIILIGCRKRTGKDTVANFITKELAKKHIVIPSSCVDAARQLTNRLFPDFNKDSNEKDGDGPYDVNYRDTMINIVKACLATDPLCFTKDLVTKVNSSQNIIYIVPDLRRIEEAEYIADNVPECNRLFVKVENSNVPIDEDAFGEGSLENFNWDLVINNSDTIESLYGTVRERLLPLINEKTESKAREVEC